MTPRPIPRTRHARAARAGILLARHHMSRPLSAPDDIRRDVTSLDLAGELFIRAYIRTKLRIGALQRDRASAARLDDDGILG